MRAVRPVVVWCLLIAVPVFGMSGTLVDLLGHQHVHRSLAAASTEASPMSGWIDLRRKATTTTVPRAHSHAGFERHHHDRDDHSVIALDGGLQGGAADDGGTASGSMSHVLATSSVAALTIPDVEFDWLDASSALAMHWIAAGPLRPPKT